MRRLLACLVLLPLSACGGDTTPVRVGHRPVRIELTDFRLVPQRIRVKGPEVTIRVRNTGRVPHALRLEGPGGARKIATLLPGASGEKVMTLRKGDWRMFCPLGNHDELGQYGALEVR